MAELDACGGEAASDEMPRGRGRAYNKYDGMFLKDAAMAARLANASGVTAKFEGGVLSVKMLFGPIDASLEKELTELQLAQVSMQRATVDRQAASQASYQQKQSARKKKQKQRRKAAVAAQAASQPPPRPQPTDGKAAPSAPEPAAPKQQGGAPRAELAVHPAAATVMRVIEKTMELCQPPLFGSAPQRAKVQRSPTIGGQRLLVVVPADSVANNMHDDALGFKLGELAGGNVDVDQGVAALLAQHDAMDTVPAQPVSSAMHDTEGRWKHVDAAIAARAAGSRGPA